MRRNANLVDAENAENEPTLAIGGVDTAENDHVFVSCNRGYKHMVFPAQRPLPRSRDHPKLPPFHRYAIQIFKHLPCVILKYANTRRGLQEKTRLLSSSISRELTTIESSGTHSQQTHRRELGDRDKAVTVERVCEEEADLTDQFLKNTCDRLPLHPSMSSSQNELFEKIRV